MATLFPLDKQTPIVGGARGCCSPTYSGSVYRPSIAAKTWVLLCFSFLRLLLTHVNRGIKGIGSAAAAESTPTGSIAQPLTPGSNHWFVSLVDRLTSAIDFSGCHRPPIPGAQSGTAAKYWARGPCHYLGPRGKRARAKRETDPGLSRTSKHSPSSSWITESQDETPGAAQTTDAARSKSPALHPFEGCQQVRPVQWPAVGLPSSLTITKCARSCVQRAEDDLITCPMRLAYGISRHADAWPLRRVMQGSATCHGVEI